MTFELANPMCLVTQALQRLIQQKCVGQQRAQVNRGVEIVDQQRADSRLAQDQRYRAARDPRIVVDGIQVGIDATRSLILIGKRRSSLRADVAERAVKRGERRARLGTGVIATTLRGIR
jgi:hypothetical protein